MNVRLFTIQNYILLKRRILYVLGERGLFTIQNYILLKLYCQPYIIEECLFTIQNYILLKLAHRDSVDIWRLFTIKNYTPLKLLSMRYPCVVVLQPYKTTQLSNPNIICKKESPKEKVKEKKSQIIDSFSL